MNFFLTFLLSILILIQSSFAAVNIPEQTISIDKPQKLYYEAKEYIENFREKQAIYFSDLRDKTKIKLNIKTDQDILDKFSFEIKSKETISADEEIKTLSDLNEIKIDNIRDYGTLIMSISLATFFSSQYMFYGIFTLLIFLILRFFFRMFI